jgi:hypothetical protein
MTKPFTVQPGQDLSNQPEFAATYKNVPSFDDFPFTKLDLVNAELENSPLDCVSLDLEDLDCFEVVDRQFSELGVTFVNAIALHPSNPAYPPHSRATVLMGAPKSGWFEATFRRPVSFVSSCVTSSRRTVLAAFDADDQPLVQAESPEPNLAGSDTETQPNVQLSLRAANIHRVTFYAFDGNLTIGAFSFGF